MKDKKNIDLNIRPEGPWFSNYDYAGPVLLPKLLPAKVCITGK